MGFTTSIKAVALSSFSSASVSGSYQAISTALPNACGILRIMNASNQDITISYNGSTDHEVVLANSTLEVDSQKLAPYNSAFANFKIGTVVYAKGTAGTGTIYVSAYYISAN